MKSVNIPKITVVNSTLKIIGAKTPDSNAAAATMYAYFTPDRIIDFRSVSYTHLTLPTTPYV